MEKVNPTIENWRVQFTSLICLVSGRLYLTKMYIKNRLCPGMYCIIILCLKENPQMGAKCIRSKRKWVKMRMFMCFSRFGRICEKLCKKVKYSWADHDKLQLYLKKSIQFSSVQSLSRVRLFATPWITAHCLPSTWINKHENQGYIFLCGYRPMK